MTAPLTLPAVLDSWRWDTGSAPLILVIGAGYAWAYRRARARGADVGRGRAWCFAVAIALWVVATMSMVGVYAHVLFWVRALQVLLLLMIVPFFLATSRPVTVLRAALTPRAQQRLDAALATRWARVLAHPLTTSVAMLATPWLLYLTPWYVAALQNPALDAITRLLLVVIGFGYFYARLQTDPVPRRYSQMISLIISIVETLGDGLLGIVLWLGPLIAADYYLALHRDWGPSQRVDQSIGAGILWLLGDVLGVPFLVVLMRAFSADDKVTATEVDAALDQAEQTESQDGGSTLWWEKDPQLRERFRRG
ncbi:MAG: cytochrome c oxidase assembly protein [Mycobacteriaceae bacterium]|nr:cytochrome c oxidase assembly protein [Mycobacteriaceae bacterium]MBV9638801.1 cytochrome c oxidase assembly protein [Mycobacteriaceae bacterium]